MTYEEDLERVNHKLKWDGIPVPKVVAKVVAIRPEVPSILLDADVQVRRAAWIGVGTFSFLCCVGAFKLAAMCWTLLLRYAR